MFELEALICEREGMIAENKQREYLGQAMAYTEDAFLVLADKIRMAQLHLEPELEPVCDECGEVLHRGQGDRYVCWNKNCTRK